jgi:hypothetical protein
MLALAGILPQTALLEHDRHDFVRRKETKGLPMTPDAKLASMGLTLPEIPKPLANYVSFKRHGDTLYLSGQGPRRNDGTLMTGKVGRDVTVEQAYEHAKLVGLGLLAAATAARPSAWARCRATSASRSRR